MSGRPKDGTGETQDLNFLDEETVNGSAFSHSTRTKQRCLKQTSDICLLVFNLNSKFKIPARVSIHFVSTLNTINLLIYGIL